MPQRSSLRQRKPCEEDDIGGDPSILRTPIHIHGRTVEHIINGVHYGTPELRDVLLEECDIILECKVCRALFRDLPNLISHKRKYCKKSARELNHVAIADLPEERVYVIQPEEPTPPTPAVPSNSDSCQPPASPRKPTLEETVARIQSGELGHSHAFQVYSEAADKLQRQREEMTISTIRTKPIPTNPNAVFVEVNRTSVNIHERPASNPSLSGSQSGSPSSSTVPSVSRAGRRKNSDATKRKPNSDDSRRNNNSDAGVKKDLSAKNLRSRVLRKDCKNSQELQKLLMKELKEIQLKVKQKTQGSNSPTIAKPIPIRLEQSTSAECKKETFDKKVTAAKQEVKYKLVNESDNDDSDTGLIEVGKRISASSSKTNAKSAEGENSESSFNKRKLTPGRKRTSAKDAALSEKASSSKNTQLPDNSPVKDNNVRNRSLVCQICHKIYGSIKAINFHYKVIHGGKKIIFPCLYCPKVFYYMFGVTRHLEINHGKTKDEVNSLRKQLKEKIYSTTQHEDVKEDLENGGQALRKSSRNKLDAFMKSKAYVLHSVKKLNKKLNASKDMLDMTQKANTPDTVLKNASDIAQGSLPKSTDERKVATDALLRQSKNVASASKEVSVPDCDESVSRKEEKYSPPSLPKPFSLKQNMEYKCKKCKRRFSRQLTLKNHESLCQGKVVGLRGRKRAGRPQKSVSAAKTYKNSRTSTKRGRMISHTKPGRVSRFAKSKQMTLSSRTVMSSKQKTFENDHYGSRNSSEPRRGLQRLDSRSSRRNDSESESSSVSCDRRNRFRNVDTRSSPARSNSSAPRSRSRESSVSVKSERKDVRICERLTRNSLATSTESLFDQSCATTSAASKSTVKSESTSGTKVKTPVKQPLLAVVKCEYTTHPEEPTSIFKSEQVDDQSSITVKLLSKEEITMETETKNELPDAMSKDFRPESPMSESQIVEGRLDSSLKDQKQNAIESTESKSSNQFVASTMTLQTQTEYSDEDTSLQGSPSQLIDKDACKIAEISPCALKLNDDSPPSSRSDDSIAGPSQILVREKSRRKRRVPTRNIEALALLSKIHNPEVSQTSVPMETGGDPVKDNIIGRRRQIRKAGLSSPTFSRRLGGKSSINNNPGRVSQRGVKRRLDASPGVKSPGKSSLKSPTSPDDGNKQRSRRLLGRYDNARVDKLIDARNFKCLVCGEHSSQMFNLRRHVIRKHLHWSRFQCKLCRFASFDRSECHTHIARNHRRSIDATDLDVVDSHITDLIKQESHATGKKIHYRHGKDIQQNGESSSSPRSNTRKTSRLSEKFDSRLNCSLESPNSSPVVSPNAKRQKLLSDYVISSPRGRKVGESSTSRRNKSETEKPDELGRQSMLGKALSSSSLLSDSNSAGKASGKSGVEKKSSVSHEKEEVVVYTRKGTYIKTVPRIPSKEKLDQEAKEIMTDCDTEKVTKGKAVGLASKSDSLRTSNIFEKLVQCPLGMEDLVKNLVSEGSNLSLASVKIESYLGNKVNDAVKCENKASIVNCTDSNDKKGNPSLATTPVKQKMPEECNENACSSSSPNLTNSTEPKSRPRFEDPELTSSFAQEISQSQELSKISSPTENIKASPEYVTIQSPRKSISVTSPSPSKMNKSSINSSVDVSDSSSVAKSNSAKMETDDVGYSAVVSLDSDSNTKDEPVLKSDLLLSDIIT